MFRNIRRKHQILENGRILIQIILLIIMKFRNYFINEYAQLQILELLIFQPKLKKIEKIEHFPKTTIDEFEKLSNLTRNEPTRNTYINKNYY